MKREMEGGDRIGVNCSKSMISNMRENGPEGRNAR